MVHHMAKRQQEHPEFAALGREWKDHDRQRWAQWGQHGERIGGGSSSGSGWWQGSSESGWWQR